MPNSPTTAAADSALAEPPSSRAADVAGDDDRRVQIDRDEPRNLLVLAAYQITLRVGWIFKTESVVMPEFLDTIAGPGWVRGFLPLLSRFGLSVPPVVFAETLRQTVLKKRSLAATTTLMAVPFLSLAAILFALDEVRTAWLPPLFLLLYFMFFALTGLNQLAMGTLQGKLISAPRRGRLLGISGIVGSACAVTAALLLLGRWLSQPGVDGFRSIFIFNGTMFVLAGLIVHACREPRDAGRDGHTTPLLTHFRRAWDVYRGDREFRRAAHVGVLFLSSLLLFPHYQWLGREHLGTPLTDLMWWVVAQNVSIGILSAVLGAVADRRGYRLVVRLGTFGAAVTPLLAVFIASPLVEHGRPWYWLTFALLGFCPVTIRAITNYTLELTGPDQHPRYLSTMTICYAIPFLIAPVVGWLVDLLPYQIPFLAVSALTAAGGLLTFRMSEPRHGRAGT